MRQLYSLRKIPSGCSVDAAAVAALFAGERRGAPGKSLLEFLHGVCPVEYISVVRYDQGAPRQLEGHSTSLAQQDVTRRCFLLYQERFAGFDEATRIAEHCRGISSGEPEVSVLHYDVDDLPEPRWRELIFQREQLTGRLSFIFPAGGGTAVALNLYRDRRMPRFSPDEVERFAAIAPLVRVAHQRLAAMPDANETMPQRIRKVQAALEAREAQGARLSPRESEVVARIACGISNDGIAADLGVSPATVLTLRKRAYLKLGIHNRMQLLWLAGLQDG